MHASAIALTWYIGVILCKFSLNFQKLISDSCQLPSSSIEVRILCCIWSWHGFVNGAWILSFNEKIYKVIPFGRPSPLDISRNCSMLINQNVHPSSGFELFKCLPQRPLPPHNSPTQSFTRFLRLYFLSMIFRLSYLSSVGFPRRLIVFASSSLKIAEEFR